MGKRSRVMNGQMWLPGLGWQTANDELRGRLERVFGLPMIGFALMILPILAVEYFLPKQVHPDKNLWLVILLDVSTAFIWVAFTTEFIVMASVSDEKFTYCRQHWLDLAIILLPLISFARALRVARAARLGRLGNMSRLYRLRGLAMRAFRAVLLLDVFKRLLLIRPERRLARLQRLLGVKERELEQLRREIAELAAIVASRQQSDSLPAPPPTNDGCLGSSHRDPSEPLNQQPSAGGSQTRPQPPAEAVAGPTAPDAVTAPTS
jgi:voltage-gated potassium channel